MCYDVEVRLEKQLRLAKYQGNKEWIEELTTELKKYRGDTLFHVSGFEHPYIPIVTAETPITIYPAKWGLVPAWVKTEDKAQQFWNNTLNARAETMFEKPSFKNAAIKRHCIVPLTSFFEHHHKGGKTFPFRIKPVDDSLFFVAGIWEETKVFGENIKTFAIVTTKANELMTKIHNSPKLAEPRMPLILDPNKAKDWLHCTDEQSTNELITSYPDELMEAHPVWKLRGKDASANTAEATEKYYYEELNEWYNE